MPGIFSHRVLLTLFAALILDATLMPTLRFGFAQPVLLYLMILYAAFKWDKDRLLILSFVVGMIRDFSGAHAVGIETFSLVSCSLVLMYFIHKIDRDTWTVQLVVCFLYMACSNMLMLLMSSLIYKTVRFQGEGLRVALVTAVLTSALLPLFFMIAGRLFGERGPMKQYELFRH